jgi:hypothetical protein
MSDQVPSRSTRANEYFRASAVPASRAFEPRALEQISKADVVMAIDAEGYVVGVLFGASVIREFHRGRGQEFPRTRVAVFSVQSRGSELPWLSIAVDSVKGFSHGDDWYPRHRNPPASEGSDAPKETSIDDD